MIYSKDSNVTLFVASQEENPELINSLNLSLDNNEKKEISIEDMSIENFDLMALEGLLLANKKLRYLQNETGLKRQTLIEILSKTHSLGKVVYNPQLFMELVRDTIRRLNKNSARIFFRFSYQCNRIGLSLVQRNFFKNV